MQYSEFTKNQIIKFYQINSEKIEVIPLGLEINNRNSSLINKEFKLKFGLPNKQMLLFVGRINNPRKGLEPLLLAFKYVLEEIRCNFGNCRAVGTKQDYLKLSKKFGISRKHFFHGICR